VSAEGSTGERRRRPNPSLPNAWKWGFPVLAAALTVWGAILLLGGLSTILDSRRGETRGAVTDPTAAGFEAFVEQTWSMLVATQDESGELVEVAVVAASDRSGGGGTVLLVPVEASISDGITGVSGYCEAECRLVDQYRKGGLDAVRAATAAILDVQVTGATLLTPARWESLAGAVEPVSVALEADLVATAVDGTSVVRFPAGLVAVASADVVELFGFPSAGNGGSLVRLARQGDWWRGWIEALQGGDPRDHLPNLELDVIDLLATVARGRVRVVAGPWIADDGVLTVDTGRLTDVVVEMFPFPIPRVPGQRPSVRLLNGTGDPGLDAPAREAVLRAGVELAVVGNYRNDGVIQTRVIHRDPTDEAAAEALAIAIGGGVLFDQYLSPVTDLTVVIGADFVSRAGVFSD